MPHFHARSKFKVGSVPNWNDSNINSVGDLEYVGNQLFLMAVDGGVSINASILLWRMMPTKLGRFRSFDQVKTIIDTGTGDPDMPGITFDGKFIYFLKLESVKGTNTLRLQQTDFNGSIIRTTDLVTGSTAANYYGLCFDGKYIYTIENQTIGSDNIHQIDRASLSIVGTTLTNSSSFAFVNNLRSITYDGKHFWIIGNVATKAGTLTSIGTVNRTGRIMNFNNVTMDRADGITTDGKFLYLTTSPII